VDETVGLVTPEQNFEDALARYRTLAQDKKDTEEQMKVLKESYIEPYVRENGTYKDDEGWAMFKHRSGSESYDTKAVDAVCVTWKGSGDRKLVLAAETLAQFRTKKADIDYLEVR